MAKAKSAEIIFTDTVEESSPKFRKQWTKNHKIMGEINTLPSQTIPDTSMSVKTMLERVKRGLPISSGKQTPVWNGEKLLPDWKRLDLIDRARIRELAKKDVETKERRWKQEKERVDQQLKEAERLKQEREKQEAEKVENEAQNAKK